MKRLPIILVVIVGLLIASTATAFLLIGGASPVTLPNSAFTSKTIMAMVIDLDQADSHSQENIKDTIADVVNSLGDLVGGQRVAQADLTKINEGIDRFFGALKDQKIQAFAMTMEMDLNEMIRNGGEGPPPEPVMTMMIKAGKEPDVVALAAGIMGEEVAIETAEAMTKEISFEPLSDGWYAIEIITPDDMFRVPSGSGDAAVASKFNKTLAHSSGGLLQAAFVIPEDTANALAGKMAADMPDDAPEAMREVVRSISDLESVSYAIDLSKGIGLRYYVVFENADAAKRMMDAYAGMMEDLPALFEATNEVSPVPEKDKEMILAMQERMDEMMDLMEISQDGATIKFEMEGENFSKMMKIMSEIVSASLPGA